MANNSLPQPKDNSAQPQPAGGSAPQSRGQALKPPGVQAPQSAGSSPAQSSAASMPSSSQAPQPAGPGNIFNLANLRLLATRLFADLEALPTAALAGLLIMFFAWSCEHQARQHDLAEAKQVKKQAAEDVSRLQQQAAGALRDAKQNADTVQQLETERQQLARQADGLRQRLESLHQQELASTSAVATLSTSEVVSRVAARLQKQVSGEQVSGASDQVSGKQVSGVGGQVPGTAAQPPAPNTPEGSGPALELSGEEARKVETAFLELDSCRQQTQVMGQQVSNCEQQAKLNSTIIDQQSSTIAQLKSALADKDQILARTQAANQAELKAVRGTWRSRFVRAAEYCAAGFIVGVLVR